MGRQDTLTRIVTVLPFDSRLFTATRAMIGRARRHSYATRGPETRQAGFISFCRPTSVNPLRKTSRPHPRIARAEVTSRSYVRGNHYEYAYCELARTAPAR
jgi:hypothetical protein